MIVAAIPAYNEVHRIAGVVTEARRYVDKVLVCDDGSWDGTTESAGSAGATVIRHPRNMGYGAALSTLFKMSINKKSDIVVTLDGDGQHDASEIPVLVKRIEEGDVDLVIGSRFLEGSMTEAPTWRNYGIKVINRLSGNGSVRVSDSQSGFRAYNRRALHELNLTEKGMGVSTEILIKAVRRRLSIAEVPIHVRYFSDTSTYNPLTHGLNVALTTIKYRIDFDGGSARESGYFAGED